MPRGNKKGPFATPLQQNLPTLLIYSGTFTYISSHGLYIYMVCVYLYAFLVPIQSVLYVGKPEEKWLFIIEKTEIAERKKRKYWGIPEMLDINDKKGIPNIRYHLFISN